MKKSIYLSLLFFLASLSGLWAQGFTSLYSDLDELDRLMSLQQQTQEQQRILLQSLEEQLTGSQNTLEVSNQTIKDLKSISETQAEYLVRLQEQLKQAEHIRQAQLKYQKGLGLELKLWRAGTIVLGASTLGLLIWGILK